MSAPCSLLRIYLWLFFPCSIVLVSDALVCCSCNIPSFSARVLISCVCFRSEHLCLSFHVCPLVQGSICILSSCCIRDVVMLMLATPLFRVLCLRGSTSLYPPDSIPREGRFVGHPGLEHEGIMASPTCSKSRG
jgi:hypothetical protein